jgi:hypothetical protein
VLKTTSEGGEPEIVVLLEKTVEDEKVRSASKDDSKLLKRFLS